MRPWLIALVLAGTAFAEPKPAAVDIKPYKDKLVVLTDAQGGVYAAMWDGDDAHLFYGTSKTKILYEQVIVGRSRNGDAWDLDAWTPRLSDIHSGSLLKKEDGSWQRYCWGQDDAVLTQLAGDKAKAIVDKYQFMSTAMTRKPRMLARDDAGVYYYIDEIRQQYGGKGYRVFIGKKGAMKQQPLTDVAIDNAGDVFSTKSGDIRLVRTNNGDTTKILWVKGDKKEELIGLDTDANSPLIWKDLGIYEFLGTLCDNV
jgi:hypothetical protein